MFIGFIAIIVALLIIVAVMSTGSTSGSGGIDQTKATKMVSEISALQQAAGFYKTTTANNDYGTAATGDQISVVNLQNAGIIASADIVVTSADGVAGAYAGIQDLDQAAIVAGSSLIASKAVPGLFYSVAPTADGSQVVISVVPSSSIYDANPADAWDATSADERTTLANSLESAFGKFAGTATVDTVGVASAAAETDANDAAATISFR